VVGSDYSVTMLTHRMHLPLTRQFANKPTRNQSSRGLVN